MAIVRRRPKPFFQTIPVTPEGKFELFWNAVADAEAMILANARTKPIHAASLNKSLSESLDILLSYAVIPNKPKRLFDDMPRGERPIKAASCHEALEWILNPPEQWFGCADLLRDPAYERLVQSAKKERENSFGHSPVTSALEASNPRKSHPKTKPGQTPKWLPFALTLLKDSEGGRSSRSIARELGIQHTTLLRSSAYKAALRMFVRSNRVQTGGHRHNRKSVRTNERTNDDNQE